MIWKGWYPVASAGVEAMVCQVWGLGIYPEGDEEVLDVGNREDQSGSLRQ